jgi:magnesium-transporting ATPase (P-type)
MFKEKSEYIFYFLLIYTGYVIFKLFAFLVKHIKKEKVNVEIININKIMRNDLIYFSYTIKYFRQQLNDYYIGTSKAYRNPYLYKIGKHIKIFYTKSDITNFLFNSISDYWYRFLIWLFQLPLIILSVFYFFYDYESVLIIAFIFISIISSIIGYKYFTDSFLFLKNSLKAAGKIIDYKKNNNLDIWLRYSPIIEFKSVDNQLIIFQSDRLIESNEKSIGQIVKVRYDKNFPEYAKEDSFLNLWLPSIFFIILCLFLLSASLVLLVNN